VKAHPFSEMCARLGATPGLIPSRTPRLNEGVERSHQTDDVEFYHLRPYVTRLALERAFRRWLWDYNHTRLHLALGAQTPLQVLRTFPERAHLQHVKCYPC